MHSHYARRLLSPAAPPPPGGHGRLVKTIAIPIAAVVVCVSLAYVLLDSIIRICRRRQAGHPTHPQPPDHPPPDPECVAQLTAIPVLLYHVPPPPEAAAESCSVCLGDYEEGEEVRALPKCGHLFHRACIDEWLLTRSSFCPVCRDRVIKRDVEPTDVSSRRNSSSSSNSNGGGGGVAVLSPTRGLTLLSSVSNGHFSSML